MTESPMKFGAEAAREQDRTRRDEPTISAVAERLFSEPFSRRMEKARPHRPLWAAAAVTAFGLALGIAYYALSSSPMGLTVDGEQISNPSGVFVEARGQVEKAILFSDGSRIVLLPATGARIVEVSARGANVLVERGTVHVAVVHREDTDWRFAVGPFSIRVTGTAFDVSWQPEEGSFAVTLQEGSVEVEGSAVGKTQKVVAGETLRAWTKNRKVVLQSTGTAEVIYESNTWSLPSEDDRDDRSSHSQAAPAEPNSKIQFASNQKKDRAPHEQKEDGLSREEPIPVVPEKDGPGPVAVLKQAAEKRLSGDFGAAKQTYLKVRRDFGGTEASAMAAFSLGRIAFDHDRDYRTAAEWFQTFIVEYKGTTLGREALGRLMESFSRAGDRQSARETARRYLNSYPDGPLSALARSVIDE